MIYRQIALVRRELWEHRSLYVTPVVVGLVMTLMLLTGYVFASGFHELVDLGIVGAQNMLADAHRRAALGAFLFGIASIFFLASGILAIFYCLDALYAERKDKSILFWRSLPITDAETVISKLLTVGLAIPLIAFAVVVVTHLVNLVVLSAFVSIEGGSPAFMVWKSVPLLDVWMTLLVFLLALPIWFSPFIGWFLFVSAWTKRMPLLTAFLPILVLPMLEYFVFRSHFLFSAIQSRFHEMPIVSGIDPALFLNEEALTERTQTVSLLSFLDIGKFLTSPALWGGVLVCGVFITAAIYIRRYRDDT